MNDNIVMAELSRPSVAEKTGIPSYLWGIIAAGIGSVVVLIVFVVIYDAHYSPDAREAHALAQEKRAKEQAQVAARQEQQRAVAQAQAGIVREREILEARQKAARWWEGQFSSWDGRHYQLVRKVKHHLHDPKSFEHVETKYLPDSDGQGVILVFMTYRARNGFGALRLGTISAKCYRDGRVSIIDA